MDTLTVAMAVNIRAVTEVSSSFGAGIIDKTIDVLTLVFNCSVATYGTCMAIDTAVIGAKVGSIINVAVMTTIERCTAGAGGATVAAAAVESSAASPYWRYIWYATLTITMAIITVTTAEDTGSTLTRQVIQAVSGIGSVIKCNIDASTACTGGMGKPESGEVVAVTATAAVIGKTVIFVMSGVRSGCSGYGMTRPAVV